MAMTTSDLRILRLLTDPLIERVMKADRVDRAALEANLRTIADGLASADPVSVSAPERPMERRRDRPRADRAGAAPLCPNGWTFCG